MAARVLKPLFDRVLVQRAEAAKKIGNIFVPETAQSEVQAGTVVAVGPGARSLKGTVIPMSIKVGDKVLLPKFGGEKVEIDKVEYTLFQETEIFGIIE